MSIQRCCPPSDVVSGSFEDEAALYKAFADPYRLSMLGTLARASEEVCVCDFTETLPLNQPTVSHHLRVLRKAGLVTCERRGTWVYYQLAPDALTRIEAATASVFRQKVLA
jgi:ArsR family transcriptional regulator